MMQIIDGVFEKWGEPACQSLCVCLYTYRMRASVIGIKKVGEMEVKSILYTKQRKKVQKFLDVAEYILVGPQLHLSKLRGVLIDGRVKGGNGKLCHSNNKVIPLPNNSKAMVIYLQDHGSVMQTPRRYHDNATPAPRHHCRGTVPGHQCSDTTPSIACSDMLFQTISLARLGVFASLINIYCIKVGVRRLINQNEKRAETLGLAACV